MAETSTSDQGRSDQVVGSDTDRDRGQQESTLPADQPHRAGGTPVSRSDLRLPPLDPRPLRDVHHGQTAAMWTGVVVVMIAFVVGGIAMLGPNWTLFVIACVIGVLGIAAGLVLQALGFGLYQKSDQKKSDQNQSDQIQSGRG